MFSYMALDHNLNKDQRLLRAAVHEFAEGVIRPAAAAIQELSYAEVIAKDSVWWEAKRKMREMGYHLTSLPKSIGGFEAAPVEWNIIYEELGWGSPGMAISNMTDAAMATTVLMFHPDNKRLMDEFVTPFVEDRDARMIACAGITEPDCGSDAIFAPSLMFRTKAVPDGNEWVINGEKSSWVSASPVASHCMTFLVVHDAKGPVGGGIAIVPMDSPGVEVGTPTELLGSKDFPQAEITFSDVRIPRDYLVVGPEIYGSVLNPFFNVANLCVGTVFAGLARGAFEEALSYAKARVQGGRPIAEHQIIRHKLFSMFTKVEAARAFIRAATEYCLSTLPAPVEYSAAAKIYGTKVALDVASEALQIHGAYGLTKEALVRRLFQDARGGPIGDGVNEVLGINRAEYLWS
jgi:alkylation response protein AidB-like acyl-CoA dehydrogenase